MPRVSSKSSVEEISKPSTSRSYPCPKSDCDYVSSRMTDLKRHVLRHSNNDAWKHKCPYCHHKTGQQSNLDTHIRRKHTGEKPLKCPYPPCTMTFGDPSVFCRHKQREHGYVPLYKTPRTYVSSAYGTEGKGKPAHDGSQSKACRKPPFAHVGSLPSPCPSPPPNGYLAHSPAPSLSSSSSRSFSTFYDASRSQSPQYLSTTGASSSRLGHTVDPLLSYPTPPSATNSLMSYASSENASFTPPSSLSQLYLPELGFHELDVHNFEHNPIGPGHMDHTLLFNPNVGYAGDQMCDSDYPASMTSYESCDSQSFEALCVSLGYTGFLAAIELGG